ncbi:MAG: ATP-binding cassette domain-containing protein [Burkholderiaceae bacterium]|nr:ATP-binding cassette domain-containing protein [Burkholderiaceae bacterium]
MRRRGIKKNRSISLSFQGVGQLNAIRAKHISKTVVDSTGSIDILRDVSLSVDIGGSLAILGASGSGKSTLLGVLAGLETPTSGAVFWFDERIDHLSEDDRARRRNGVLGFVFQSFQLLGHLNALENVMLPLELGGFPQARQKAQDLLDQVGMSARMEHFPKTLSGGEQQRVALARAFVTEPKLIFADEPTGSLDAANGEKISNLLFELQVRHGTTIVLVTHAADLAARCQQVLRLTAGATV